MYLETDIPLFKITNDQIEPIKNNLPELPDEKKARIIKEYNLSEDLATQLVKRQVSDGFEAILKSLKFVALMIALVMLLSSCGGNAKTPEKPTKTEKQTVEQTAEKRSEEHTSELQSQ